MLCIFQLSGPDRADSLGGPTQRYAAGEGDRRWRTFRFGESQSELASLLKFLQAALFGLVQPGYRKLNRTFDPAGSCYLLEIAPVAEIKTRTSRKLKVTGMARKAA